MRYRNQDAAKTAMRIWGESLRLRRADEKTRKTNENNKNKENNSNNNNHQIQPKNNDSVLADTKPNVGQTHHSSISSSGHYYPYYLEKN